MEIIPFGSSDIDNILSREPARAEYLPFGAILLDRNGGIVKYNKAEVLIGGRDPREVQGKNFFNDIALCSEGKRSHGEFLKFNRTGQVKTLFMDTLEAYDPVGDIRVTVFAADPGLSAPEMVAHALNLQAKAESARNQFASLVGEILHELDADI